MFVVVPASRFRNLRKVRLGFPCSFFPCLNSSETTFVGRFRCLSCGIKSLFSSVGNRLHSVWLSFLCPSFPDCGCKITTFFRPPQVFLKISSIFRGIRGVTLFYSMKLKFVKICIFILKQKVRDGASVAPHALSGVDLPRHRMAGRV